MFVSTSFYRILVYCQFLRLPSFNEVPVRKYIQIQIHTRLLQEITTMK